ncbi:unnamed protein product [Rotaria sp. Silwood1]|nr:unnamed protein product [Rotaria sp. Silwood1]CAF4875949.1 unnamed protein product [Rotaria sp. Silwood1]
MSNHYLRGILLKLQDRLSDDDRKRLHFFFGHDVPRRIRDDPSLGGTLSLMECLFDEDKINEQDFTFLIQAFEAIQCIDAAQLLRVNARWAQNGVTVAGDNRQGNATNQLNRPFGFFVDDDQTAFIADFENHRIIKWKIGDTNGTVILGGLDRGNRWDQLDRPTDVLSDIEPDSLIICDRWNRRVVRWSRRCGTIQRELLVDNTECWGLAMDDQGYLYISDTDKHEVRRYQIGDKNGTIVAGGHGEGAGLNQLNRPTFIFIDQQQVVYVSDYENHRVMKWNKNKTEGIIVAGGQGGGNALTQLSYPYGLFVDKSGTLYVADTGNHRVMRWSKGAKQGTILVGENGSGAGANQLLSPTGLSFDRHGNLYVTDQENHRVQRFSIK